MKKLFALALILFGVLSTCCTASLPEARAKVPDVTSVKMWRDFELVLHADTDFPATERTMIEAAAGNIRRLTHDRARPSVAFDLDFTSVLNLRSHADASDWLMIRVSSDFDIVEALERDAHVRPPSQLVAATQMGTRTVYVVIDRVRPGFFEEVVTHELGHVIGFPDLDAYGSVMSGTSRIGSEPLGDWTDADVALCKSFSYCD